MANIAITGAGRGIALEIVKLHLAKGDRIFALLRDPDGAAELNALAADSEGLITLHAMDVSEDESVRQGTADTGDTPVDILYNVAGVLGPRASQVEHADFDEWLGVLNVNVIGPMRVFQAFLPRLREGSRVVNFGSQMGASTWTHPGAEIYCTSKAAVHKLTQQVATGTTDRGIIAISVHPGWVQTDMGGPGADITPQESASGIVALAGRLTPDMSGGLYKWTGEPHAW
ncbi:SDR family NAD(P)-dependent oxidoreductase [Novosphingobium sp. 9]|uniref:SDR family NAD(P)-dependent oxidoreductase n=1 Tax=Novosphingobium sp. 9 TaxID=2025349 RepID=UPI0021B61F2C|nr:SDR family NAD(P)-dependent oxidoreductase [Novosphingobium sp. 9]